MPFSFARRIFGRISIRQRIAVLAIALLLPMNALIIAALVNLANLSHEAQYKQLQYTASVIASSVEARLTRYLDVARALSTSPFLFDEDLSAFKEQAAAAFPDVSEDRLFVSNPAGDEIMNLFPLAVLPHRSPEGVEAENKAFATHAPVIAGVYRGMATGEWIAAVDYPIFRDGKPFRSVGVAMSVKGFFRLLDSQNLPEGWVAEIADDHGRFVARSGKQEAVAGQPISDGWETTLHHRGIAKFKLTDGTGMIDANEVSPMSGWTIGIAVSENVFEAPVWLTLRWAISIGIGVSLLSLILSVLVARRIAGPIGDLERQAPALVSGHPAAPADGLPEVERVWDALQTAITERQRVEQDLRVSEELLRTAAEGAQFGAHDYDALTGRMQWSPQIRRLLGFSPGAGNLASETGISFIHREDRERVRAAFRAIVKSSQFNYELEFRVVRGDGEVRWVLDRGQTIKDPVSGRTARVIGVLIDITERKLAELSLSAQLAEIDALYRTAPIGLAVLDKDAHFVRVNEALASMTGRPVSAHIGQLAWDIVPHLRQAAEPILKRVIANGERAVSELSGEAAGKPGAERQWIVNWYPVRDALDQRMAGVTVEDVTSRNAAARRQEMLVRELSHRVKNTLAIVQSIAMQTLRTVKQPGEFAEVFSSRLMSLARAHDLLTQRAWEGASLSSIASQAIAPFLSSAGEDAFDIRGPAADIPANSTITLALMLHELLSNAAKYGALSVPGGRVSLAWTLNGAGNGREIVLHWQESGGPSVKAPERQGFGTQLLMMSAEQLGGRITIEYAPEGLRCNLRFPLAV
jgi:PAS domain S-box-containing protein